MSYYWQYDVSSRKVNSSSFGHAVIKCFLHFAEIIWLNYHNCFSLKCSCNNIYSSCLGCHLLPKTQCYVWKSECGYRKTWRNFRVYFYSILLSVTTGNCLFISTTSALWNSFPWWHFSTDRSSVISMRQWGMCCERLIRVILLHTDNHMGAFIML